MENGCEGLFQGGFIIAAIIAAVLISIAGVSSMGFIGIMAGPVVVLIGWLILSAIF